ncbi:hypothetical protein LJB89_04855 [Tyzzerella sp. OttesenSCG-928-J15]|nr:hypothetical protein [Tyzzerella sp. OttesenSCG-928-J15]
MNIVTHYPVDRGAMVKLQKKVAVFHAQAIYRYISSLPMDSEERRAAVSLIEGYINGRRIDMAKPLC